jgi:hypothetical protein
MKKIQELEKGKIGLIQEQPDGTIIQLGLNEEQTLLLQYFLAILSKESPIVKLDSEYELIFKNNLNNKK